MAAQAQLTVDFKPTKRIKKRRELDALVSTKQRNLGRSGSVTGRPELLGNESETSELEEFDVPAKTILQKRNRSCTCSSCVGLGCGVLLAVCLVSICGLVWVFVQLRKDMDELQAKLAKVDGLSSNVPAQLRDLNSAQANLRHQLEQFDDGLNNLRANVSIISNQVKVFDGSLKALGRDVAQWQAVRTPQPSDPASIVDKNKHLVRDRLSEEETDDEASLEQLRLKRFSWVEKKLDLLNVTFHQRLEEIKTHSVLVDVSVSALTNYTMLLNKRMRFLEVPPASAKKTSSDELYHPGILQRQIGMLNTTIALTSGKLDAVVSSFEKLRNSTESKLRMLNLTAHELSARLKLIEVTVHMMLSDNVASEATPGGKIDQGPLQSSPVKPLPSSSSSTTESNMNQMKIKRSAAVLQSLPRS